MTKKNYEEMRKGIATEVFIPVYENLQKVYKIPLTAVVFHSSPIIGCVIISKFGVYSVSMKYISDQVSKMVYNISGSLLGQSGLYTYKCSGIINNVFTDITHRITVSTSLYLTFVNGKSIL